MNFSELNLAPEILKAVTDLGFVNPMPVQEQVIPFIIEEQADLVALAQTGTGKTAAFGLPILNQIDPQSKSIQALVLAPTRELCVQITNDLRSYAAHMKQIKVTAIYGGAGFQGQLKEIAQNPQIIVATPGRMNDMINRGNIKLQNVNFLVLDEADEMLNMGFEEDVSAIIGHTPKERRTFLFSATMPSEVEQIAHTYMHKPKLISIGQRGQGASTVKHIYFLAHARDRYLVLKRIADYYPSIYGIVFCRTRQETQEVADSLIRDGYSAESLHGDLSQGQRDFVMNKFRNKNVQMLVATDVAARGIDVDDLTHVINYNLPDELESYVHRSGRTGRAGKTGTSISIVNLKEKHKIKVLERQVGKEFSQAKIPSGHQICEKQLYHLIQTMENVTVNEEEVEAFLPVIYKKLEWMDKEELIKRFVSIEFNRFLDYYRDAGDLNVDEGRERNNRTQFARMFMSIGRKDGLIPPKLIGVINDFTGNRNLTIGKIELGDTFSFVEIDKGYADQFKKAFEGKYYNNRAIRVDEAEPIGSKKQGRDRSSYAERGSSSYSGKGNYGNRGERSSRNERGDRSERSDRGFGRSNRNDRGSKGSSYGNSPSPDKKKRRENDGDSFFKDTIGKAGKKTRRF